MKIDKIDFKLTLEAINCCYSENVKNNLPTFESFPEGIFKDEKVNISDLLTLTSNNNNPYLKSVIYRIVAISEMRKLRDEGKTLDISKIWRLIYDSLLILPSEATISSIGSQGFLSIPLFKYDKVRDNFDFIRLHIWDNSLEAYYNKEKCDEFSIHTHSFFAESWIICGKVINNRYKIHPTDKSEYSLFTVGYNKSLNEINQHTSSANNTGQLVNIEGYSNEIYQHGEYYNINAGSFHQSGSKGDYNGLSATLFSFTANNGIVDKSYVVGPSHISSSEINRKTNINPISLLDKINNIL